MAGPAWRSLRYSVLNWGYLRAHRKLVGALALVVFAVYLSDSSLLRSGQAAAGNLFQPVVDQLKSRAAYQIVDDFDTVGEWWTGQGLVPEKSGAVRVAGFALHEGTMDLTSYRMDFDAKIERRSLGWVVRAADPDTYYAFKLNELGRGKNKKYQFVRYPVVQGQASESKKAEIDLPDQLIRDDFNRISVRIRDSQLITFINGRSVDYWSDARLPKGGVGFWVEKGESGLVDKMAVSGNEDFWGLTIYGALQTLDTVNSFVKSLIADPEKVASQLKKGVSDLSSTAIEN